MSTTTFASAAGTNLVLSEACGRFSGSRAPQDSVRSLAGTGAVEDDPSFAGFLVHLPRE